MARSAKAHSSLTQDPRPSYPSFDDLHDYLESAASGGSGADNDPFEVDALIIGAGIGGLTLAYDLARQGLKPLVCDARSRPGGLIATAPIGGITIDIGAESYATRTSDVVNLIHELDLEIQEPHGISWVYQQKRTGSSAVPIPHGMLGIPASLDDPVLTHVLSDDELATARKDLSMGADIGSECETLGDLVEQRLGIAVVDKLVTPIAGGIYSASPYDLAISNVLPGVMKNLPEAGSLTGAVAALRGLTPSSPQVSQTAGGMFRLIDALSERIQTAGGAVFGRTIGSNLQKTLNPQGDRWAVDLSATAPGPTPADPPVPTGQPLTVSSSRVVIATPGEDALKLVENIGLSTIKDWELPKGKPIAHVTFAVRDERLDCGPRGSGMLVSAPEEAMTAEEGAVAAKAITHYSYKWQWPLEIGEPHTHIFRVSYGRAGHELSHVTTSDGIRDASLLLGVDLQTENVLDAKVIHWGGSLPPFTPQHRERVKDFLAEVNDSYLNIVGAWVAGSGLAAVIAHARQVASKLIAES